MPPRRPCISRASALAPVWCRSSMRGLASTEIRYHFTRAGRVQRQRKSVMILFEWILVLLFAAVVLTAAAERLRMPYPSLLAIAGAGIAFLPFAPDIRIEPDLALALFVAPALLDAAFDTSPQELRRNVIPVVSLAVFAVVLTTAARSRLSAGASPGFR